MFGIDIKGSNTGQAFKIDLSSFIKQEPKTDDSQKKNISDYFSEIVNYMKTKVEEKKSEFSVEDIIMGRAPTPPELPAQTIKHPNAKGMWNEPPKIVTTYYVKGYPGDPNLYRYNNRYNNGYTYYDPYQRQMINNAYRYIQNRGPWDTNYIVSQAGPMTHPNQPRSRKWVNEYAEKMKKDLSDPTKIGLPRSSEKVSRIDRMLPGFVPAHPENFKDDADLDDNNYYRMKQNMEDMTARMSGRAPMESLSNNKNKYRAIQKKTPEELELKKQIRMSKTTPSINPKYLDYNFVGKSGEGYWSLGKAQEMAKADSQQAFTPQEKAYAKAAALKGYNRACYIGSDLAQNPLDDSEEGEDYEKAGYEEYMRQRFGYIPSYDRTYFGGYGYVDNNGLPTRWFDDRGKMYTPSQLDYNEGRVIRFSVVKISNDTSLNEPESVEITNTNTSIGVKVIKFTNREDGGINIDSIYDVTQKKSLVGDELTEIVKKNNSERDKLDAIYAKKKKIPTEREQFMSDDSFFLAKELSRYNEWLADILLWYRKNAIPRDYNIFINKCREQLTLYRNEDPFAVIKSGVINASKKIIIVNPKPTTDEEIDSLINAEKERADRFKAKLIESGYSEYKAANIAYKELNAISKCKTFDEKVVCLRSMRNLMVVTAKADMAMQMAEQILSLTTETRRRQITNYELFKKSWKLKYDAKKLADPIDDFDKQYDDWWNLPYSNETSDSYANAYSDRMLDLNYVRLMQVEENALPGDYLINIWKNNMANFLYNIGHDANGNNVGIFGFSNNMDKFKNDYLRFYQQKHGLGFYKKFNRMVSPYFHNYALYMQHNPEYLNQGLPTVAHTNPSMVPIFNDPGLYENRQQTFVNAMFHKHKMGSVM